MEKTKNLDEVNNRVVSSSSDDFPVLIIVILIVIGVVVAGVVFIFEYLAEFFRFSYKKVKNFLNWLFIPEKIIISGRVVSLIERDEPIVYSVTDSNNLDFNKDIYWTKSTFIKVRNYFGESFKIKCLSNDSSLCVGKNFISYCSKMQWRKIYDEISL